MGWGSGEKRGSQGRYECSERSDLFEDSKGSATEEWKKLPRYEGIGNRKKRVGGPETAERAYLRAGDRGN